MATYAFPSNMILCRFSLNNFIFLFCFLLFISIEMTTDENGKMPARERERAKDKNCWLLSIQEIIAYCLTMVVAVPFIYPFVFFSIWVAKV